MPARSMFRPTQDRIALQLIDESTTASGLKLVSFDNREDLCQAKVLAVGPDCRYVQPDQTILVFRYSTWEIEVDEKPLTLTREAEIIAIVG